MGIRLTKEMSMLDKVKERRLKDSQTESFMESKDFNDSGLNLRKIVQPNAKILRFTRLVKLITKGLMGSSRWENTGFLKRLRY